MAEPTNNQNGHTGRRNGKPVGRPVGISGFHDLLASQNDPQKKKQKEQQTAGKQRGRPRKDQTPVAPVAQPAKQKGATKAKQKQKQKRTPDKQPLPDLQDFKVPADFHSLEDPRIAEQLERIAESLIRTNDDFIPFADEASRGDINNPSTSPIANWYAGASRYLPLKLSYLAACANLGWIRSQQAKVECTYDGSGRLKSRKITQSTGNPAYLTLAQSLLDAEMKWAEKMKPAQNTRIVLDVPAGGDVRKHKIVDLIRKRLGMLQEEKQQAADSSQ